MRHVKKMPTVSIVTPTKNQAVFLPETIESVLCQDYSHIEYQVIDGGSTDDTCGVLKHYEGKFLWESQDNLGQTDAINKGWDRATGEILAYINSDDTYLHAHVVSEAVAYLEGHPEVGIVYGRSVYTNIDGVITGEYRSKPFDFNTVFHNCENVIAQPSVFIRRSVIEKIGLLDGTVSHAMDFEYWLRAGLHFKIDFVDEVWSTFRLHPASKSMSGQSKLAEDLLYIYKKIFSSSNLPQCLQDERKNIMVSVWIAMANAYFNGGDAKNARRYFFKAFLSQCNKLTMRHTAKTMATSIPYGLVCWQKYKLMCCKR